MRRAAFLSIFLSLLIFHHPSLDHELARPPHVFFPSGDTQQAQYITSKTPTQSQFSAFFFLACFYIHPYTNNAQTQSQLQNPNPIFYTISNFLLPMNTAIYLYVLLILHLILWLTFELLNGDILFTTSTLTSFQAPFRLLFPSSHSLFSRCFFLYIPLSLVCLSVCLFKCLNVSVYLSI